jgi:hypothetical protein
VRSSRVKGRSFIVLCLLAGLLLTDCSPNSTSAKGAITGVGDPCVGPYSPTGYQKLPVTVYLTRGSRPVAHQTVEGTHTYRFVVPAGHYVVATHEGEGSKPVAVVARSGKTTHANIPSYCK